jgi:hypothetical protein
MSIELLKKYIHENDIILLGKDKYRLFGITSFSLKKEVCEHSSGIDKQTLASIDAKNVIRFYGWEGVTRQTVMFALLHELMHLLGHHLKRKSLYPLRISVFFHYI